MHAVALVLIPNEGNPNELIAKYMEPYDENIRSDFIDNEEENRKEWEEGSIRMARSPEGNLFHPTDERFRVPGTFGLAFAGGACTSHKVPDDHRIVHMKLKDLYPTFEDFMAHYAGVKKDPQTGRYGYWSNDNGKWDWYQIGGRWTGSLTGYDPREDPDNVEICNLCGGSGMRNDQMGVAQREIDAEYTCNGCQGKGEHVKWPTDWKKCDGDIQPVSHLLSMEELFIPYTLVDSEGWVDRGEDEEEWGNLVRERLSQHDGRVAVVDYHS